jgi:antitoxin PrlF
MPRSVCTALGLRPGAKVDFVAEGEGFKLVPLKTDVSALKGRFAGRVARPVSIKAMNDAIGDAATARQRKSGRWPFVIGLDTNVLVRYLAQDDPKQSASATRFIETRLSERSPGFISLVVLVETLRGTGADLQRSTKGDRRNRRRSPGDAEVPVAAA